MDKKEKKLGWRGLPIGGVSEDGSAEKFVTGDWREERPIINFKKCRQCFLCWSNCPDNALIVKNQKIVGINYVHCKGCGICAKECPNKAITMLKESK